MINQVPNPNGMIPGNYADPNAPVGNYRYQSSDERIAEALERIAAALERAYPTPQMQDRTFAEGWSIPDPVDDGFPGDLPDPGRKETR